VEITAQDPDHFWFEIGHHLTATRNGIRSSAPSDVVVQAGTLLGNHSVAASVASFDASGPSIWTVSLITDDDRLIHVRMKFDEAEFDSLKEQNSTERAAGTVIEAWVRRLSDIVCLGIRAARLRKSALGHPISALVDVGGVSVTFRDGTAADLAVDQTTMTLRGDRGNSDEFMQALRERTGL